MSGMRNNHQVHSLPAAYVERQESESKNGHTGPERRQHAAGNGMKESVEGVESDAGICEMASRPRQARLDGPQARIAGRTGRRRTPQLPGGASSPQFLDWHSAIPE